MASSQSAGRWVLKGEAATLAVGRALGRLLAAGDVVGLVGDLGAGKTTLTRGVAEGCTTDPDVPVTSPTFTLLNVYPGPLPVVHVDFYRLVDEDDLESMGLWDAANGAAVVLAEWCDRIPGGLANACLRVDLVFVDLETRHVTFQAETPRGASVVRALASALQGVAGVSPLSPPALAVR